MVQCLGIENHVFVFIHHEWTGITTIHYGSLKLFSVVFESMLILFLMIKECKVRITTRTWNNCFAITFLH